MDRPVDLADFMGVISLHFSTLIIAKSTLFDAILLTTAEKFFVLAPPSEDVYISKFSYLEVGPHMTISLLFHEGQFLEFVSYECVPSFPSGLRFHTGNRGNSKEKGLFGDILKLVVDPSAQKDGLVTDESDEHEVVGGMRVVVEQIGG